MTETKHKGYFVPMIEKELMAENEFKQIEQTMKSMEQRINRIACIQKRRQITLFLLAMTSLILALLALFHH